MLKHTEKREKPQMNKLSCLREVANGQTYKHRVLHNLGGGNGRILRMTASKNSSPK